MEGEESSSVTSSSTEAAKTSQVTSAESVTNSASASTTQDRVLPIMKRGQFFKDSFFEKVWGDFETAMNDMVVSKKENNTASENSSTNVSQQQMEVEKQIVQNQQESASTSEQIAVDQEGGLKVGKKRFDRLNSYMNLRDWAFEEDNQAATVTKESNCYKVSMLM